MFIVEPAYETPNEQVQRPAQPVRCNALLGFGVFFSFRDISCAGRTARCDPQYEFLAGFSWLIRVHEASGPLWKRLRELTFVGGARLVVQSLDEAGLTS